MNNRNNIDLTAVKAYHGTYYPYFSFEFLYKNDVTNELWNTDCALYRIDMLETGELKSVSVADNSDWIGEGFVKLLLNHYFELKGENIHFAFDESEIYDGHGLTDERILEGLEIRNVKDAFEQLVGLNQRGLLKINPYLLTLLKKIVLFDKK